MPLSEALQSDSMHLLEHKMTSNTALL